MEPVQERPSADAAAEFVEPADPGCDGVDAEGLIRWANAKEGRSARLRDGVAIVVVGRLGR